MIAISPSGPSHRFPLVPRNAAICAALLILILPSVHGQLQVSTLGAEYSGESSVIASSWVGLPFTTDGGSYELSTVFLNMSQSGPGTLRAELFAADGSNFPTGAALTSFSIGTITGAFSDVTFTPVSAVTLTPFTSYVFALTPTGAGDWSVVQVDATAGFTTPAGNPWSMPAVIASSGNGGSSWSNVGGGGFRIKGGIAAVPEPALWAPVLAGALLVFSFFRRRVHGT